MLVIFLIGSGISGFARARHEARQPTSSERQRNPATNGYDDTTRSYIEEPLRQLVTRVPELKSLELDDDQRPLSMILQQAGANVDRLFGILSSLVATENVTEERLNPLTGMPLKLQREGPDIMSNQYRVFQDEYSYFIVRKSNVLQSVIEEYRRDADGLEGAPQVLFLSKGFASTVLHFSTFLQSESRFRYLGEDRVGSRGTYVVAFAQIPEVATTTFKMKGPDGQQLDWLMQGIAWVDKLNFQILQMRTDLLIQPLASDGHTGNAQLQTLVKFGETQPDGFATPVWLPSEADVNEVVDSGRFRNEHHFSNYRTLVNSNGIAATVKEAEPDGLAVDEIVSRDDKQSHPYLEESLQGLVKHIPELKGMRPATSSGALAIILEKTGKTVDDFFGNVVDLVAQEEIKQQRWSRTELIRDNYLILRRGNGPNRGIDEFRMDDKGKRIDQLGLDRGFFVTSGFALSCVHFSRAFQWDSRFRYLGDQKIDGRDAYVVGFAQLPEAARIPVTLRGLGGTTVHLFVQGISWVDKTSFHILRMRTDLLARHSEIGLEEQTTKVKFREVRLAGGGPALWLPRDVDVEVKLGKFQQRTFEETFRNLHRYKNYQRYRVSARIVTSQ